jgi:hypothetical protein
MKDFDPAEPAILHDRISDSIVSWTGEDAAEFVHSKVDQDDGTIAWKSFVFDGWGNVLGG